MRKHRILSLVIAALMSAMLLVPVYAAAEPAEDAGAEDTAIVEVTEDGSGAEAAEPTARLKPKKRLLRPEREPAT